MTPKRWVVLALLSAALVFLQVGLDRQPETREEARYRNLADLPASDMVPTYIASLFFGAFRAVVVDALWIQLKKLEEEKRWYERREILKLISYFQPRNPEVWSHLGWHSAYNVANGFTDPERSWEWVKFGLDWLKRGNTMLPDSPYLKYELARTLFHKASWRDGQLDQPLLKRVEGDSELQELLRLGPPGPRPLSSFELAIPWLEKARVELFARREKFLMTQSGLYIRPMTMDGFIRECMYFQGIYLWFNRRWEEAADWFRRAKEQSAMMIRTEYDDFKSSILEDWVKFYDRLPEIVELDRRAQDGKAEDERAFLAKLQALLVECGPMDGGFLWGRRYRNGRLDDLKQQATRGKDPQECNDSFAMATEIQGGALLLANLEPQGLDVDFYELQVPNPDPKASEGARPGTPIPLRVQLKRPDSATLDLKVTLFDLSKRPIKEAEMRGELKLDHPCDRYGTYFLKVEPLGAPTPWPTNTSYSLQYAVGP